MSRGGPRFPPQTMSHPKPKKELAQHFLTDRNILRKIVDFGLAEAEGVVVEVGPGPGGLTVELLEKGCRVLALELDGALAAGLQERFAGEPRLAVRETDALKADLPALLAGHGFPAPVRVIGNFPYNVGSAIVRRFIEMRGLVLSACALLQEEVARRMAAVPGSDDFGFLSLAVSYHGAVVKGFKVHPGSFYPPPKVDSRTVRVDVCETPRLPPDRETVFFHLIEAAFRQRRKTLARSLAGWAGPKMPWPDILAGCGLSAAVRPEEVPLDRWLDLARATPAELPARPAGSRP